MKQFITNNQSGLSILEVVLAAALFVIFAIGSVRALLQNYNTNRLGAEYTVASQFASEGLEAVRSIKNQAYANLANTPGCGLIRNASNVWAFQSPTCTNNTLVHSSSDNYIRTIKVEPVNRDGVPPAGNIVSPGGTLDPDTKKITSTVTWNFNFARPETLSLVAYLSDWIKPISALGDGILVYGRTGNTTPRSNAYTDTNNTFAANADTVSGAAGRNFVVKTSPTKQEAVVGYVDSSTLRVMCFDGTTWTNEWNIAVGGTGITRRFDITYEYQSGDVIVLYSTDGGTNELGYRSKSGSLSCGFANWSAATTFDSPGTTGVVTWIKLTADNRLGSNVLAAAWADMNRDLQAAIWDGANWTQRSSALETTLECRGTCSSPNVPNGDSLDIDFESSSGDIMVVWGSGGSGTANGAWYNKCDGGAPPSCSWNGGRTAITGMANDATSLDISANPSGNDILFASIGDGGSDLQAANWSGSAWTGTNDLDTTALTPVADSSMVATGWLNNGSTTRGVVVFANNGAIRMQHIHGFVWNGSSFVRQGTDSDTNPWFIPSPLLGTPRWYDIQMDPKDSSRLTFLVANSVNDLYAKRLVMDGAGVFTWTNPMYVDGITLEANLVQAITSPYYFSYWRNP